MGRAGDQIAQRSQLLFLHKLALQVLLALVAAAGFLQQGHQRLVLEILAQEYERPQKQHRGQTVKTRKVREGVGEWSARTSTHPAWEATGEPAWRGEGGPSASADAS